MGASRDIMELANKGESESRRTPLRCRKGEVLRSSFPPPDAGNLSVPPHIISPPPSQLDEYRSRSRAP